MVKITGDRQVIAKLRTMGPEVEKAVARALFVMGNEVQVEAQLSISKGSVSGKGHKPSRAGTAPNNDTGTLADSIETAVLEPLKVEVSANAPYAAIQEYGGSINHPGGTAYFIGDNGLAVFVPDSSVASIYLPRTKPHVIVLPSRPFMRPALQKLKPNILKAVAAAAKSVTSKKG